MFSIRNELVKSMLRMETMGTFHEQAQQRGTVMVPKKCHGHHTHTFML